MNNYPPTWTSRPKRRNWKGWLLALAAIALLGSMCALSFNAESAASSKLPQQPAPQQRTSI